MLKLLLNVCVIYVKLIKYLIYGTLKYRSYMIGYH